MPTTMGPNFLKAAEQRLTAAQVLLEQMLTLDAQYLGGYTVECSLKALIMGLTSSSVWDARLRQITSGSRMHELDTLRGILRDELGVILPPSLIKRLRRFEWSTALRYETRRRDLGETRAFLKTAKSVYDWVQEQLP